VSGVGVARGTTREFWKRDPLDHAEIFARTNQTGKARELLHQVKAAPGSSFGRDGEIALIRAWRGELDECFQWLEHARQNHTLDLGLWRLAPETSQVRDDPRFQKLLDEMNLE
jgi:hypothetical protein